MPIPPDGDAPATPDSGAGIIPLSRFRASLARARTRPRAVALLEEPDLERRIPRLPIQELYYAIKEVGLHDAAELVKLASPQQIRGFLDFDTWQKDRFLPERASPWLELLVDAGPDKLARAVEALDPDWVALYLRRYAHVYDLGEDEVPEEPEGHFYPTPDTFFLLDVTAPGEESRRLERLVDWLYRGDLNLARRVMMSARWGLDSDLEEHAYRWRSGRMADLGYVDYYDALSVYQYLDPTSVTVGEDTEEPAASGSGLPAEFLGTIGEATLLGRALATIAEPDELERLSSSLLLLVNRVMSADLVEPGDLEAARLTLDRTAHYIDIGLEFLGRNQIAVAGEALRSIALGRIFRVGVSLTLKLKKAADTLAQKAWLSPLPGEITLLDAPLSHLMVSARKPRPQFPLALEAKNRALPPERLPEGDRPFQSLLEIAETARRLEEVAAIGDTVRRGLGVDPRLVTIAALEGTNLPADAITFNSIVATIAANLLLERPPALVALAPGDLPRLREVATLDGHLRPTARLLVERGLAERLTEREFEMPTFWERWMTSWFEHLEQAVLVGADQPEAAAILVRKL